MRGPEDRILVRLTMSTIADLDLERIQEDPIWEMINVSSPDENTAVQRYIAEYLRNILLFTNMPCTNGPSSITVEKAEVSNATNSVQSAG